MLTPVSFWCLYLPFRNVTHTGCSKLARASANGLGCFLGETAPESKVHGTNMGPTWVLSTPDGPMLAPWTLLSGVVLSTTAMGESAVAYDMVLYTCRYICTCNIETMPRSLAWQTLLTKIHLLWVQLINHTDPLSFINHYNKFQWKPSRRFAGGRLFLLSRLSRLYDPRPPKYSLFNYLDAILIALYDSYDSVAKVEYGGCRWPVPI